MNNTKILNLDRTFPYNFGDSAIYFPDKQFMFPGGERHVNLKNMLAETTMDDHVLVVQRIIGSDDAMELFMAIGAVKTKTLNVSVFLPYMPYGRQDRAAADGDPFSLEVFINLLGSLHVKEIWCIDPHSQKIRDLANKVSTFWQPNEPWAARAAADFQADIIIAPDKGAVTRARNVALRAKKKLIICEKEREMDTGRIIRYSIGNDEIQYAPEELEGKRALIVDDICDGGATFIILCEALRKAKVSLIGMFVTHGIFSKGFTALRGADKAIPVLDKVYTTNSFRTFGNDEYEHYKIPTGFLTQYDITNHNQ
jgi:ribose-phosphate pyrophosphokinase